MSNGPRGADLGMPRTSSGSEERLRLLVESVVDYALFVLDLDGTVASWNPGAERLKGYRAEEIVGRHYSTFYPAELRDAGVPRELLARALVESRVEHSGWRVRKDGSRFWANVVITALRDESGAPCGFAKVTRDMTDLHEAAEARERALDEERALVARLRELERWRREFTDSIAHDLQTPVTAIDAFAHLLEGGHSQDQDEHDELLAHIRSNARALQALIDDLRAEGQLNDGQVHLEAGPVRLGPFITRLVGDMQPVLAEHPTTVEVDEVVVDADRRALERVLRNLLGNAVKHTPAGTAVHVTASADGEEVAITVADEGPGIPADLLPRVFDRFQAGSPHSSGLGLDIARRFVELHGGTLTVDSQPGAGARFRVALPSRPVATDVAADPGPAVGA